ncbi:MAG: phosphate ABC transporter permease PstA [Arachnia propionica]|uniref:phosphate ABC transporter permease PstA n=1 Tax=Arachnia propionica TaxID=1750 RepID=UPI0027109FEA|nr:phosphate ABC transporter permease PstA [Arachnia propionica]
MSGRTLPPPGLDLRAPSGIRTFKNNLATLGVWLAVVVATIPLLWILVSVTVKGAPLLFTRGPDHHVVCVDQHTVRVPTERCGTEQDARADASPTEPGLRWLFPHGGRHVAVGERVNTYRVPTTYPVTAETVVHVTDQGSGDIRSFSLQWWTTSLDNTTSKETKGGALQAIYGTLLLGILTAVVAVPVGMLGAIFLVEYGRGTRAARLVSFMVDILTGVPSIVAALFIYAMFITTFGFSRSAIATVLALALLMLPMVLRSTEEMLKLVPDSLREAAWALGVPKWRTILSVVVPTSFNGILTGVVLGIARVMGETAPLLILIGYAKYLYLDPFGDSMGALPTMINDGISAPAGDPGADRVWAAALTLVLIVMVLNLVARRIAARTK